MDIMKFFESQKLGGFLSVLSVILTIATFVYTERKKMKEQTKQSIQLIDDIVNLIVRNCVNNQINVSKINLQCILEGFSLLKDGRINCNQDQLIKMVYTRVYENEFLVPDVKKKLLDELENNLFSTDYEEVTKTDDTSIQNKVINIIILFAGTLATAVSIYTATNSIKDSQQLNTGIKAVLIIVLVILFSVFIIKALVPLMVKYASIEVIDTSSNKSEPIESVKGIVFPGAEFYASSEENVNEIKISDIGKKEDIIVEALKQKYILENLIRKIYTLKSEGDSRKYPIILMLKRLKEYLIDEQLLIDARGIYMNLLSILNDETLEISDDFCTSRIRIAKIVNLRFKKILENIKI